MNSNPFECIFFLLREEGNLVFKFFYLFNRNENSSKLYLKIKKIKERKFSVNRYHTILKLMNDLYNCLWKNAYFIYATILYLYHSQTHKKII